MKLKELIFESPSDLVARFYKEAGADFDRMYNLEDVQYKDKNTQYYDTNFKEWYSKGITPVFTKPQDNTEPLYNTKPTESKIQSPGYRGLQYALSAAGLPYNHRVQRYEPNASAIVASDIDPTY